MTSKLTPQATTKIRILSSIGLLFFGATLILYSLSTLQQSKTATIALPYPLLSCIVMICLLLATLALIHLGCKNYSQLLARKTTELDDISRLLIETQASLEEAVERRTFELAVVNGSLHREITERIQAETEGKKLQNQLEIILDSAGEGIFGIDTLGNVTFINKTASRQLGWRRQDLIGHSHHDLVHHSHPNGTKYPIAECPIYMAYKDGAIHCKSDETFWTKDGTGFPVEYTSTPIVEDGNLAGAVVVFRDISESNRLKKQLELIVNSTGDGIFGLDNQGNVTFVNKAASIMLGWEPSDLIGNSHHNLVHHTHAGGAPYPEEECPIAMAYKDGTVHYKSDDTFWTKSGEPITVEYNSTPILENRQLTGAVVIFRIPDLAE